jgi:hypothetical protein
LAFYGIEEYKRLGKTNLQNLLMHSTLYNLLESSKEDISKHYFLNAEKHVGRAIDFFEEIKKYYDKSTIAVINSSIADLELIKSDINNRVIYEADLNVAYANAMNALALAHLIVCEDEIRKNKMEEAIESIKHTILHLHHAIKYSSGEVLAVEEQLIMELADLSASGNITTETIHRDVLKIRSILVVPD